VPDLTIQVQEVKGVPGTALVILNGSIDAKTVITFQTHLNSVKERGVERFIMDMENVKYVNSTGLGYLINLSDSVSPGKGGIALVKVQPKVKVVFDMLGLNAFFKIFPTREEALKAFSADAPAAAPAESRGPARTPAEPIRPTQAPTPRIPTPAVVPAAAPAAERYSTAAERVGPARAAESPVAASAEPLHVECQACRALLAVRESGTYRCPRCLSLFNYAGGDRVSFLPRSKAVPVQLSLSFTPECTEGLLEFVRRLSQKSGFSPQGISEVQSVVKDTVETIRRHAYGGSDGNVYHVLLVSVDSELEMRFADYGTPLSPDRADLFASARRAMDRFELRHHPKGGNVITVSKKAR
jgi:anti-sigma B factor antagonist